MQESELINIIKNLSEKVKHLYLERQQQNQQANSNVIVPETASNDPFIKTRMPMTELEAYPELLQTIPAMQKDFFCSPMTEEERKNIIYSCPKVTGLNYTFLQLNDTASNTVKKIRNNQGAKPELDDVLEFAEIMRVLISDLASSITQSRVDNLYKTMELPGRAPQLLESANKPLTLYWHLRKRKRNPEEWAKKALSTAPAVSSQRQALLLQRRQITKLHQAKQKERKTSPIIQNAAPVEAPIIISEHVEEINEQSMGQRNCKKRLQDTAQENRNSHTIFKILPHIPQVYLTNLPQLPNSFPKYTSQGAVTPALRADVYTIDHSPSLLQAKNNQGSKQGNNRRSGGINNKECNRGSKGRIKRSRRCISSHINSHILPKIPEICMERQTISMQSPTVWPIVEPVDIYKVAETREFKDICSKNTDLVYNKLTELGYKIKLSKSSLAPSQSINHLECLNQELSIVQWESPGNTFNATHAFRTKELFTQGNQVVGINYQHYKEGHRKYNILERGVEDVERSILFTRESKYRKYYRQAEAHKRKGIDCCLQSLIFTSSGMPHNIKTTVKDIGEYMDTLLENKNKAANSIYSITDKPCGCFQQFYSTNGILVQGKNRSSPELSDNQLKNLGKSLPLPTLESNFSDFTENITRENNSNNSNSILGIRDMVPNNNKNDNNDPNHYTSNRSHTRPKKRKISASKNKEWKLVAWEVSRVPSKRKVSTNTLQKFYSTINVELGVTHDIALYNKDF
ncbi:hypothetical protein BB561_003240 [Smittium simulii]|uniref:Uncharacterized protein n=1 Tax=Smittium simulii TaxID=133385 RepID=A0A2T9YMG2_9FUNG|nr:hypothetical protein BB561_003240 [Smittium simulii]